MLTRQGAKLFVVSGLLILFAHPSLQHSRLGKAMLERAHETTGAKVHDLYELYPDFAIDAAAEQAAVEAAHTLVWQHPLHWYGCPPLLKEWMDVVLSNSWVSSGEAAHCTGKRLWHVVTAGDPETAYASDGRNRHPLEAFLLPLKQTALQCSMEYLPPFTVYGGDHATSEDAARHADAYACRLDALKEPPRHG